ncbi:MAG: DUF1269 domain-containing protein [Caldilineaceae bacterium]
MSENLNEQVIVGFFADAAAADHAADALRNWDKANDDIKLGTMGRITLGEDGKVEAKRYGAARAGRGALVGGAIGILAAGVTGGLSLLAGAVGGGAIGGVTGKLTHGSLGLTDEAAAQIKQHLTDGGAALVVLCDDFEVEPTMAQLKAAGGKVQGFGVSAHVLQAIHNHQVDNYRDAQIMDDYTNDLIV